MAVRPYWIPISGRLGVGVTAYSEADALSLFEVAFGSGKQHGVPTPVVDLADLDQGHVIPNMGNHLKRGIWFPLGYE